MDLHTLVYYLALKSRKKNDFSKFFSCIFFESLVNFWSKYFLEFILLPPKPRFPKIPQSIFAFVGENAGDDGPLKYNYTIFDGLSLGSVAHFLRSGSRRIGYRDVWNEKKTQIFLQGWGIRSKIVKDYEHT